MNKLNKIAIDIGHNLSCDRGAIGIRKEDELNHEVGINLIEKCKMAGFTVINCTPKSAISLYDSLNQRVTAANSNNADIFISIHHNAQIGGKGSEILCYKGGKGENIAKIILSEIVKLGYRDRGIKYKSELFVIRETVMPAILIECAFCDSPQDMKNYNPREMANAIFNGLCKAFEIKNTNEEDTYYTVVKGDTLWGISRRYGVSLKSLIAMNGIKIARVIFVGQRIRLR